MRPRLTLVMTRMDDVEKAMRAADLVDATRNAAYAAVKVGLGIVPDDAALQVLGAVLIAGGIGNRRHVIAALNEATTA